MSFTPMRALATLEIDRRFRPAGAHPGWIGLEQIVEFARAPSSEKLATIVGEFTLTSLGSGSAQLPWPVGVALMAAKRTSSEAVVDAIARGQLGSPEVWEAAEHRWSSVGVRLSEIGIYDRWNNWAGLAVEGEVPNGILRVAPNDHRRASLALYKNLSAVTATETARIIGLIASFGHRNAQETIRNINPLVKELPSSEMTPSFKSQIFGLLSSYANWDDELVHELAARILSAPMTYYGSVYSGCPRELIELASKTQTREWAIFALFALINDRELDDEAWPDDLKYVLHPRSEDSTSAKDCLIAIRASYGVVIGMLEEEALTFAASENIHNKYETLHSIHSKNRINQSVEAFVRSAALALITEPNQAQFPVRSLLGEVVAAQWSRFRDPTVSSDMKLPPELQ